MASVAEPLWGPALIGVFISLILYGVIICQTFFYYRNYSSDTRRLRCFVGSVVFIDTIHSFTNMFLLYNILVDHYNDPSFLPKRHWLFVTYPSFVGLISCVVQLFFAWRVRVLTGNIWLYGVLSLICLATFGCGLAVSIEAGRGMTFSHAKTFRDLILVGLLISMTATMSLTCVLTWYLRKPALLLGSSNDLVKRISRLSLSNGLVTTLWTAGAIVCYYKGGPGSHLIFCYPLPKLYISSMLTTLNTRPTFHETQMEARPNILGVDDGQARSGLSCRKRASSYSAAESQTPLASPLTIPLVYRNHLPPYRDCGAVDAERERFADEYRESRWI